MDGDGSCVWRTFDGVLFGRMYEDAAIELRAFAGRERVFAIASAGCTARALAAAGHRVTAVDVNPRQLGYARARADGAPGVEGTAGPLLAAARRSLGLIGRAPPRRRGGPPPGELPAPRRFAGAGARLATSRA